MLDNIQNLIHGAEKIIFGVERSVYADVLGIAGMSISFIKLLSPLPAIIRGLKNKELKNLSSNYLLLALVNSILWGVYGFKVWEFAIYLTNTFAFVMFLFYYNSALYINGEGRYIIPYTFISITVSALTFFFVSKEYVGLLAFVMSSLWMLTSIEKMRDALIEKSPDFINLPVILTSLVGNLIWLNYGLVLRDFYVVFPNALGLVLYFLNLIIYLWVTERIADNNSVVGLIKIAFLADKGETRKGENNENSSPRVESHKIK